MNSRKEINELMSDMADKAYEIFNQGWTKAQLINTLTRKGMKLGEETKIAIDTAWNLYEVERKAELKKMAKVAWEGWDGSRVNID